MLGASAGAALRGVNGGHGRCPAAAAMTAVLHAIERDVDDPNTLVGALALGIAFLLAAMLVGAIVRRAERRVERRLTDVTGLRFASALMRVLAYLVAAVLYAHVVPRLHSLGTALLTGVSVMSIVLGLAAQNTLGNLIAGLSLVLYRPIHVGDRVQLNTPKGLVNATVDSVSLGYTILDDGAGGEVVVPNSVMVSNIVVRLPRGGDAG